MPLKLWVIMKMTFTGSSARNLDAERSSSGSKKVSGQPSLISLIRSHSHTKQPNELSVRLVCLVSALGIVVV